MRRMIVAFAVCMAAACSGSPADRGLVTENSANLKTTSAESFMGTWRCVTPTMEFLRLTVSPLSVQQGALGVQLAFSGVMWEGSGKVAGDSLRLDMAYARSTTPIGTVVIRPGDAQTLRVQARPASATALDLTFVREN
jgi:hypothetical protein